MGMLLAISAGVMAAVVVVLAVFGVSFVAGDFRHYNEIVKECREQGRIQNNSIRILCQVEERK